jgi:hypothetical protein
MTKEEEIRLALEDLKNISGVIGTAVVTSDGLLIYSDLPENVNKRALAAMAAAIVGTGMQVTKELGIGTLNQAIVEAVNGKFISISVGTEEDSPILSTLVSPKANIGLVLLEMEKAAKKIRRIMG